MSIEFSKREIHLGGDAPETLLAVEPVPGHATDAIAFDDTGSLFRIDLKSGASAKVHGLTPEELSWDDHVSLVVSRGGRFAALTSSGASTDGGSFNRGVVVDLESGLAVLRLDCGDYHTNHAPFAVAFVERGDRTLVLHGTDWNRIDATDPRTGECLTERKHGDDAPDFSEGEAFTEWLGELIVSPDQTRVATIGWMWHPVGVAFGWSLDDWLSGNPYEPDSGPSKRQYAMWNGFWFSPFFWYDNSTLCIWGDPDEPAPGDSPPNGVVFYDAATGERKRSFSGPTMNSCYFDQFLFTEATGGDGLGVWDLEKGALVHEEPGIAPLTYHPGLKEFLEVSADGWTAWRWRS